MALITNSIIVDLLLALIPVVYFMYWYLTNNDDYWDKRGVPNDKRVLLFDSLRGKISQSDTVRDRYKLFPGHRFFGIVQFKMPVLFVKDPKLIHKILVKDFSHFPNRVQPKVKKDPFGDSLFGLKGQIWRQLRYKLTPTFSTGKLKGMFEQVSNCGDNMMIKIETLSRGNSEVEAKSFLFEFTLDVIASCAFGMQFKPGSPEFIHFKSIVSQLFSFSPLTFIRIIIILLFPKLADFLHIRGFTSARAVEYFTELSMSTKKFRRENNISRNDYFQLLLSLQEQEDNGKELTTKIQADSHEDDSVVDQMQYANLCDQSTASNNKSFTDDDLCSNTFVFLLAGSESTSSTVALTLYEISRHQDVQKRLLEEVDSVLAKHGGWSYAAVKDMTYLDQVFQEAQRLYPVLPFLSRECEIPYRIPDTDLVLEKGTQVLIPVIGLHTDPEYYPDPEQFRPERFEGNNFKPSPVYMPFGDGPRICIAMRFAVMEVKTCLAKILSEYTVKLDSRTKQPLEFEARSLVPSVKGGIWMTFEKRAAPSNVTV